MKKRLLLSAAVLLAFALHSEAQGVNFKVLHNFGYAHDGYTPSGPLFLDSAGNLYGGTVNGPAQDSYGIAFKLTPQSNGSWSEEIIHIFNSTGGSPYGAFVADSTGNVYGTNTGAPDSNGGVFELSPTSGGWNFNAIYSDWAGPGLLLDKLGNLYGAIGPGVSGDGAIGELSHGANGWTYTQLYSFCNLNSCPDGDTPLAPPIWDGTGNLWGTTLGGGYFIPRCIYVGSCGVLFVMTPNGDGTWTYHVMHGFGASASDGIEPQGGLVMDSAGNFYGSTWVGGLYNHGTIFKFGLVDGQWTETILYNFNKCPEGCRPIGTLARDSADNLYGVADGGANSCGGFHCGVVFKLAPQENGAWQYSVLYNLNQTSGGRVNQGLVLDGQGNLYGVTISFGKYGGGTAFEIISP